MSAADTPSTDCAFDAEYRQTEDLLYDDTPVSDLMGLVNTTGLSPPRRVLDLGCGTGRCWKDYGLFKPISRSCHPHG